MRKYEKFPSTNFFRITVLPLAILVLNLLKVPLTFNKVEKTKNENFDFLFFFGRHDSKSIQCMGILNIPNDCSATHYIFTGFELRVR